MSNLVLEPESYLASDDEEFLDEKLAANWHGRRNIGAKLKPEVYTSAVVEQGCLDMGGSDTGQAKKTSGLTKHISISKLSYNMDHQLSTFRSAA